MIPAARGPLSVQVTSCVGATGVTAQFHVGLGLPETPAETKVSPTGSWSVTTGAAASEGPELATVMV